tara:strand:- start:1713 stop:1919 length:207 start_codon:yes stop_codon:yes gene_type:complete
MKINCDKDGEECPDSHWHYSIDVSEEDLHRIYVKQWVLDWCRKYHPEAFEKAENYIRLQSLKKKNLDK